MLPSFHPVSATTANLATRSLTFPRRESNSGEEFSSSESIIEDLIAVGGERCLGMATSPSSTITSHAQVLLSCYYFLICTITHYKNFITISCLMQLEHKCHSRRVPLPTVMASSSNSGIPFPVQERKRRLSMDQIDSLERSFQEETKLEPERKMKLAQELCLQPRQVAVWFQNRRARWKAKQLERVYYALKQEFDAISRERQKLQEEVSLPNFQLLCLKSNSSCATFHTSARHSNEVTSICFAAYSWHWEVWIYQNSKWIH